MKHEKEELTCSQILENIQKILASHNKKYLYDEKSCVLLPSRKHYVIRVKIAQDDPANSPQEQIIKYFNPRIQDWEQRWQNEIENYDKLRLISQHTTIDGKSTFHIPPRYDYCEGIIIYAKIEGKNFEDTLISKNLTLENLRNLASWLYELHKENLVFGDQRLRNFLIDPHGNIYGVDFEDIHSFSDDGWREDLGEFLGAFLDIDKNLFNGYINNTIFKTMKTFLQIYLDLKKSSNSGLSIENSLLNTKTWVNLIIQALKHTSNRRDLRLNDLFWNSLTKTIEQEFKKNSSKKNHE
jgi:hypothetical protein